MLPALPPRSPDPSVTLIGADQVLFIPTGLRNTPNWREIGLAYTNEGRELLLYGIEPPPAGQGTGEVWRAVGVIANKTLLPKIVTASAHYIGWVKNPLDRKPQSGNVVTVGEISNMRVNLRLDRLVRRIHPL